MAKVTFRQIEDYDLPVIQYWRNSDHVMPYCRQYRHLTLADMEKWYKDLHRDKDFSLTNDFFLFFHGDKPAGVCGLTRIDWRNRKAEVSFYVGINEDVSEIIEQALPMLIQYGLTTLGLWKIYFPVYEFNPWLDKYKEVMSEEYIALKEYYWNGKHWDRIILVAYGKS